MKPGDVRVATVALRGPAVHDIRSQLLAESDAMLRLAFASGLPVPPAAVDIAARIEQRGPAGAPVEADPLPLPLLAQLHAQLASVVAPATPRTIYLLDTDPLRGSLQSMLGPLPNVRRLTVAAGLCTIAFVLLSVSPLINEDAMAADIYALNGWPLLVSLCFLLTAAAMGSLFHALFTAQRYVAEGTYDPRYDASYWIRIGLGVVAGLLLSVLVPIDAGANAATMTKPLLALLGGFSAGLVHRVLNRLVDTVESLFQGDRRDLQKQQNEVLRVSAHHATAQARVDIAEQLIGLRDELARGAPPERLHEVLSGVVSGLLNRPAAAADAGESTPSAATPSR
jgi:hypothetical protein